MSWMRAARFIAIGLGLAYALPAACGSGGVVGGKCRSGYSNCNGLCVDLQTDYESCGSCGNECPGDLACVQGLCGGEDGGVIRPQGGASNAGGESGDAGNGASGLGGNGELPDGGFFDSPVDGQGDADTPVECLPPHDAPSHCGDCETRCMDPAPLCAPDGNDSFVCVPVCDDPLVECNGQCVDPSSYNSDPDNCGRCARECPSDICQAGVCVGARYGNVALLCSDFGSATSSSSLTTLLGNAIFMPATNPVRVLAYTRGASAAAVNKVNQLIGAAGMARGRTAVITEATTVSAVIDNLSIMDFEVLLIHDLDQASPGAPRAAATTWETGSALTSFASAGGAVVVLNGADGIAEMHELISAGNLLNVSGQTDITFNEVFNSAPNDALSANVVSPFLGTSHTCTFETNAPADASTIFVLTDEPNGEGAPVAIHRVVAPP